MSENIILEDRWFPREVDTKMLSITVSVDLIGSTLVGKRIVGRRLLEVNISKNVSQSLLFLTFSILQLKSPKTIAFFCGKLIKLEKSSNKLQKKGVGSDGGL